VRADAKPPLCRTLRAAARMPTGAAPFLHLLRFCFTAANHAHGDQLVPATALIGKKKKLVKRHGRACGAIFGQSCLFNGLRPATALISCGSWHVP